MSHEDRRRERITSRVYDVTDLVTPVGKKNANVPDPYDTLTDLITSTVFPMNWSKTEEQIAAFRDSKSLIITHTGAMHDGVSELIQQIRANVHDKYIERESKGLCGFCGSEVASRNPSKCQHCVHEIPAPPK